MIAGVGRARLVALVALTAACGSKKSSPESTGSGSAPTTSSSKTSGWYLATISGKGAEIPFFLHVPHDNTSARIVNGREEVVTAHRWTGQSLEVDFPLYHTKISAKAEKDGVVIGRWASSSGSWGSAALAFRAVPIPEPKPDLRFGTASDGDASWQGVYKVTFADDSGEARLELVKTQDGELVATLQFHTGNADYLAGFHSGNRAKLSGFDGTSPYLLTLEREGDKISGTWLAGQDLSWKEGFAGERAGDFHIPPQIPLETPPRLEIPQLAADKYRDKPIVLELGASWCPACTTAAPYLVGLYDKFHPQGIEFVTLTYELTTNTAYNQQQAEMYKKTHKFAWDVIPVDGDDYNNILPAELEGAHPTGFPIVVFVDRTRTVRAAHVGFPSVAARAEIDAIKTRLEHDAAALLAPSK